VDYDESNGQCVCRAHPCWDDNGLTHTCNREEFPYLSFSYEESGDLVCECSSSPHESSIHVSLDLCRGHKCSSAEHPVLDWDDGDGKCVCRSHPCWNDQGQRHECKTEEFPVLRYREEEGPGDEPKPVCECARRLEQPREFDEL